MVLNPPSVANKEFDNFMGFSSIIHSTSSALSMRTALALASVCLINSVCCKSNNKLQQCLHLLSLQCSLSEKGWNMEIENFFQFLSHVFIVHQTCLLHWAYPRERMQHLIWVVDDGMPCSAHRSFIKNMVSTIRNLTLPASSNSSLRLVTSNGCKPSDLPAT